MNKFSFLYLVLLYALANLYTFYGNISFQNQIIGSFFLISLFGIPHGSIDNVIFLNETKISKSKFYFLYILSILIYSVFWYIIPLYSLILFFLISSYHFGESQLANYKILINSRKILYFIWGLFLMSSLLFYNKVELINLFNSFKDTKQFNNVFKFQIIDCVFYSSNITLICFFIFMYIKQKIKLHIFKSELFQIFLIHITFIFFPIIISFTLYFIFLHSIKVLTQEYRYLKQVLSNFTIYSFIKLLIPHSLISLIFIFVFLYLSNLNIINISMLLFSIISISVITLPHSIVMTKFYDNFKNLF